MHGNSSPNLTEGDLQGRLYGLDLIRFFSFYAILIFHLSYAFWADQGYSDVAVKSLWLVPFEVYARALVFSGFTVLLLSFFLFGLKPYVSRKKAWLWLLLAGFFVVWTVSVEEYPYIWDIYPYLLVSFPLLLALRKLPAVVSALLGGIVVSIPFWKLEVFWPLPRAVEAALFGLCLHQEHAGDWPLLPWIGWPVFAFGIGAMARENWGALKTMSRGEGSMWIAALAASLFWLGGYYVTPLGNDFSCYVFRRPPLEFWAHELWILALVRISLLDRVRGALNTSPLVHWISRRRLNRRFFLCYFLQYPLCFFSAYVVQREFDLFSPWSYIAAFLFCAVATEWAAVVLSRIFAQNRSEESIWAKTSAKS